MELNYSGFFSIRFTDTINGTVVLMRAYWEIPGNIGVKIRNLLMRAPTIVMCWGKQDIELQIEENVNMVVSLVNQIPLEVEIFLEKPGITGSNFPGVISSQTPSLINNQRVMKTINYWTLHNTQREVNRSVSSPFVSTLIALVTWIDVNQPGLNKGI